MSTNPRPGQQLLQPAQASGQSGHRQSARWRCTRRKVCPSPEAPAAGQRSGRRARPLNGWEGCPSRDQPSWLAPLSLRRPAAVSSSAIFRKLRRFLVTGFARLSRLTMVTASGCFPACGLRPVQRSARISIPESSFDEGKGTELRPGFIGPGGFSG